MSSADLEEGCGRDLSCAGIIRATIDNRRTDGVGAEHSSGLGTSLPALAIYDLMWRAQRSIVHLKSKQRQRWTARGSGCAEL